MAKIVFFNNRSVIESGAYSQILGGNPPQPIIASTGKICIVDTDSGAGYGFGSGVTGDVSTKGGTSGKLSVYQFNDATSAQAAFRGGILWDIVPYLFQPSRDRSQTGCQGLVYVRACTTTAAQFTWAPTGGGSAGGMIVINPLTEGAGANGTLDGSSIDLRTGYAFKMVAGTQDTNKFVLQFWQGTFKGLDSNGIAFDEVAELDAPPSLVCQSPEFDNISTVITWMKNNAAFKSYFYLQSSTVTGTGAVTSADLTTYASYITNSAQLASGGTETYNANSLTAALTAIIDEDFSYFLCDKYGATNSTHTNNFSILNHILTQAKFPGKLMYVGGGYDHTEFNIGAGNASIQDANSFNDAHVQLIHSSIINPDPNGSGNKIWNTFYSAALLAGRRAGLAPEIPLTYKDLKVSGITDELTLPDRELAVQNGVVHMKNVSGLGLVINLDSTTLENNAQDIYPDGSSPYGSIMAIAHSLNKDLIINLEQNFVGDTAAQASPADIVAFVTGYLKSQVATQNTSGRILSFENVSATLSGSDYAISFSFEPNGPVNRLFVTGLMFNVSLTS